MMYDLKDEIMLSDLRVYSVLLMLLDKRVDDFITWKFLSEERNI